MNLYVVRGSEDGNLGVYGSKRAAYNRAILYLNYDNDPSRKLVINIARGQSPNFNFEEAEATYANFLKAFRNHSGVEISMVSDRTTAMVEQFELNQ